jgi:hypothetical protein
MRPTDSQVKPNGTPGPGSAAPRKRAAKAAAAPAAAADAQKLAGFAGMETPAMDAQMWPVHATVWLQPDLSAAAPQASGLRIERRHRAPVPDFIHPAMAAVAGPQAPAQGCEPLPPSLPPTVPAGDFLPLGWDPRTEVPR